MHCPTKRPHSTQSAGTAQAAAIPLALLLRPTRCQVPLSRTLPNSYLSPMCSVCCCSTRFFSSKTFFPFSFPSSSLLFCSSSCCSNSSSP